MARLITHTNLTDTSTLFENVAAANAIFNALSVESATAEAEGVVKKATEVTDVTGGSDDAAGATELTELDGSASYSMEAAVINKNFAIIKDRLKALMDNLRSAGTLE
tara:strand:+ start:1104 stop:1424 length:321 start_codon:yes stop_codon:yes gene_type:complete